MLGRIPRIVTYYRYYNLKECQLPIEEGKIIFYTAGRQRLAITSVNRFRINIATPECMGELVFRIYILSLGSWFFDFFVCVLG